MRLHDSYRFEKGYIRLLEGISGRYPNVILKFKDKSPDNFLDMQVSDALITNFSSIANLFYATGKPTVHIYPVRSADEAFVWRRLSMTGLKLKKVEKARFIWKLAPEENGGLLARDFDSVLSQVDQVIEEPDCCKVKSTAFLNKYMLGADGYSCARTWESLRALVEGRPEEAILPDRIAH